jgi:hypothetical protein
VQLGWAAKKSSSFPRLIRRQLTQLGHEVRLIPLEACGGAHHWAYWAAQTKQQRPKIESKQR